MRFRLAYVAILALAGSVFLPYTAAAAEISGGTDVAAARVAAEQQLISLGINPGDAVFQIGPRNYVGSDCPGSGWNCSSASVVVQIATGFGFSTGTNKFERCTEQSCAISQTNTTGGNNEARCVQQTSANPPGGAVQECMITQTNTSGTNRAFVDQRISQSGTQDCTMAMVICRRQDAKQIAKVFQTNDKGANFSWSTQSINQNQSIGLGPKDDPIQKQEAHQKTEVCQGGRAFTFDDPCNVNSNGKNQSGITQNNLQYLSAGFPNMSGDSLTQKQNTDDGPNPNSLAVVRQNSNGKSNDLNLVQFNRMFESAHRTGDADDDDKAALAILTGTVTQTQGTTANTCQKTGLCGDVVQNNAMGSGVNRAFGRQDELQRMVGPSGAIQDQRGGEFCCLDQFGGVGNIGNIKLVKVQQHSFSTIDGAVQADCFSPNGGCLTDVTLTQNGITTHPTPCTGTSCNQRVHCFTSEGPTPFCDQTSAPPPPCVDPDVCPPQNTLDLRLLLIASRYEARTIS